jgi:hypothetical protein
LSSLPLLLPPPSLLPQHNHRDDVDDAGHALGRAHGGVR